MVAIKKIWKKTSVLLITAQLVLIVIFVFNPMIIITKAVSNDSNKIIYVDDDADPTWYNATHVAKIQEGIDIALNGDTIYVNSGVYYESINVNKQVNLLGENKNYVIVDGTGYQNVFLFQIGGSKISGFTIKSANIGINFNAGVSDIMVADNIIIGYSSDGIYINEGCNINISNNKIYNIGRAIEIKYSSFIDVYYNHIFDISAHAIDVTSSSNCVFYGNVISGGLGYGFQFSVSGSSNYIMNNIITNFNNDGISLYSQNDYQISNNIISECTIGISLFQSSDGSTISNNDISYCIYAGIKVSDSQFNNIYENTIHDCISTEFISGILLQGNEADNTIYDNNLYDNYGNNPVINNPPIADAGTDQTIEQTSNIGTEVTLDGSGSYDADEDTLTYEWTWLGGSIIGVNPTITLPAGTNIVTLTVNDGKDTASDTANIIIKDTTPPTIELIKEQIILQPANHKYVSIKISDFIKLVIDGGDNNIGIDDVIITSVSSDEPEDIIGKNDGDGNTLNDIVILDGQNVKIRAERNDFSNGRVYTINFKVTDISGNNQVGFYKVIVPINKANVNNVIDDGLTFGYIVYSS